MDTRYVKFLNSLRQLRRLGRIKPLSFGGHGIAVVRAGGLYLLISLMAYCISSTLGVQILKITCRQLQKSGLN